MKKENRFELFCRKTLPNGHVDSFRLVFASCDIIGAKAKYKEMGYEVEAKKMWGEEDEE